MWRSPLIILHFRRLSLMNFSEEVKATLWNLIDDMSLDLSDFTVNPGKDFTRKKKWDFPTLMKFIISMESQSLKNELHKYFGYTTDCPSTASFNQRSLKSALAYQLCSAAQVTDFHFLVPLPRLCNPGRQVSSGFECRHCVYSFNLCSAVH